MTPEATGFAPASVGNVGVGFDILGHTIAGPGDRVTVRRIAERTVRIAAVRGCEIALPLDAARNTAGAALIALRSATSMKSLEPTSRTLVTPACSVTLALRAAWKDCSTGKRSMPS